MRTFYKYLFFRSLNKSKFSESPDTSIFIFWDFAGIVRVSLAQTFREIRVRLPSKRFLGSVNLSAGVSQSSKRRLMGYFHWTRRQFGYHFCGIKNRMRSSAGNVNRNRLRLALQCKHVRFRHVLNVNKIARLFSIPINHQWPAFYGSVYERRYDGPVRGIKRLPWSIDVKVSQDNRMQTIQFKEIGRVPFNDQFLKPIKRNGGGGFGTVRLRLQSPENYRLRRWKKKQSGSHAFCTVQEV